MIHFAFHISLAKVMMELDDFSLEAISAVKSIIVEKKILVIL